MKPLYTVEQSRAIDRELIEGVPIDGYQLMCRADDQRFIIL